MVYVNIYLTLHGNYVYLTIAICRQKMVGFIVMVCSLILFLPFPVLGILSLSGR